MGSAPNIAAVAIPSPHHPSSQGFVQALGVFIDTILICTATGVMILMSDALQPGSGVTGTVLTQHALAYHIGDHGKDFVALAVFFFAFTSIIGNYSYAEGALTYLNINNKPCLFILRTLVLVFIVWGAREAITTVFDAADAVMGIMANPFYVDMAYTKDEVAAVSKTWGLVMTLLGAFVGGGLALRFGVMRILMLGALLSSLSNLLFAWLAGYGHSVAALAAVVSADNLASGLASAAFVGYLSSLTSLGYSATQYALFSSLMLLGPKLLAGFSGHYVNAFGYANFFTATALLGLPVLALVWLAQRAESSRKQEQIQAV